METEQKVQKIGGSLMIIIPQLYCEHLKVKDGDIVKIKDDKGKHGNFIAIWNKKQKENNKIKECEKCGYKTFKDHFIMIDGKLVCMSCKSELDAEE